MDNVADYGLTAGMDWEGSIKCSFKPITNSHYAYGQRKRRKTEAHFRFLRCELETRKLYASKDIDFANILIHSRQLYIPDITVTVYFKQAFDGVSQL
ncbi:jg2663 [Pararge aegeria aegeria]|uniref:Jg2663 protein n=1 Tax=Pararge aegeria aegeria TaxID=348720 RepID=A0A8S4QUI3_9NEOP|nr:jg2663 [Pararge aegeria aegeria]